MKKKNKQIIALAIIVFLVSYISMYSYITCKDIEQKHKEASLKWKIVESQKNDAHNKYQVISDYNSAVNEYNTVIRKFPNNIYAKLLRNKKMEYFSSGSHEIPEIKF